MTDEKWRLGQQVEELLLNNDWSKFSDTRELLMEAAHMGAMDERKNLDAELRRLKAENDSLREKYDTAVKQAITKRTNELIAERDALMVALRKCSEQLTRLGYSANHADQAIAALKQAGEK